MNVLNLTAIEVKYASKVCNKHNVHDHVHRTQWLIYNIIKQNVFMVTSKLRMSFNNGISTAFNNPLMAVNNSLDRLLNICTSSHPYFGSHFVNVAPSYLYSGSTSHSCRSFRSNSLPRWMVGFIYQCCTRLLRSSATLHDLSYGRQVE